jgi:hypothetical protein
MTDLSGVPVDALVAELVKREGVIEPHPELWYGVINSTIKNGYPTARIIVVQGEL